MLPKGSLQIFNGLRKSVANRVGSEARLCTRAGQPSAKEAQTLEDRFASDDEDGLQDSNIPKFEGVPPEPPSPWIAISAMGFGAVFAVGIACVGVLGAFHMAAWATANTSQAFRKPPEAVEPTTPSGESGSE